MTPLEHYKQDLERDDFLYDAAQEQAVTLLDELYRSLLQRQEQQGGVRAWSRRFFSMPQAPVRGLYFWGGVGRGKTYLMDVFYECLPFERKLRMHFHRFMQRVHNELKSLQGEKNPLEIVADNLAKDACVLCFDEFFVTDITDAMILGGLMERLFERGVSLVATSNIIPSKLYKDGLQRERFLPAIKLIEQHTSVINVDGGVDYRLRVLEQAELFHSPLDEAAAIGLEKYFFQLISDLKLLEENGVIDINGRPIQFKKQAEDIIWFNFYDLCDGPRSQNDYIEIAREYHAVLLADVPKMRAGNDDIVRRFINMVDEFYDRQVKLIVSAEVGIAELYEGGRLEFEFERTQSRLLEMQSHDYLVKEHRA